MRRAIGKGLAQLLNEPVEAPSAEVSVDSIQPNPRQPRTRFEDEALQELAASIRQVGVIQPLVVRPLSGGRYEIIAGERRFRAAQLAGLTSVPIVVRAAGNRESLELALIENVQREDIGPVEAARAYRLLMDEFNLKQDEVATRVGKSRSAIANTVRLLKLPAAVLEALNEGVLTEGHARPLLTVEDPARQMAYFEKIVAKKMSSREVEKMLAPVQSAPKAKRKKSGVIDESDPNWRALQERASEVLGAPVKLQGSERGGSITIAFASEDDLIRIMDQLGVQI